MPEGRYAGIPLHYVEGLRMTKRCIRSHFSASGLYGESAADQNARRIRLVVPWKYGLRALSQLVNSGHRETTSSTCNSLEFARIRLLLEREPEVDHPRWTRRKERRLGELLKRTTLKFNGYADQSPICTPAWTPKDTFSVKASREPRDKAVGFLVCLMPLAM